MGRSKIILVVMFVLALGAGVVMGVLATKQPMPPRGGHDGKGSGGGPGSVFKDFNLTDSQREQMRQIWDEFARGTDSGEKRQRLREERDQKMEAILTPEQKIAAKKIKDQYEAGLKELADERHKAWETHVEKTRAILNEEQRAKYDEMLKKRAEHGGPEHGPQHGAPHGPGGAEFSGPWGGGRRSATRGGPGTRPAFTASENNAEPTSAPARQ
jgi:Spy/CpxP family protein refolding chaperone